MRTANLRSRRNKSGNVSLPCGAIQPALDDGCYSLDVAANRFESSLQRAEMPQDKALELDSYDTKILETLRAEGRITWRDLAERIGLSLTPTLRRVRRLEEDGVIVSYGARLDRSRIDGSVTVFITVTMERQVEEILNSFESAIIVMPEIVSAYLTSGTSDYLLHATVRDLEHYRGLLAQLTRITGVAHIQSSFGVKAVATDDMRSRRPIALRHRG